MAHTFTWDVRGTSPSGRTIIYKQYSKLSIPNKESARVAAERDVNISNELMRVHPDCIFVIDAAGVKLSRPLYTFAKQCVVQEMPRPAYIHVVNCPKWANSIYNVIKRMLKSEEPNIVSLHRCSYSDIKDSMHAI